MPLAENQRTVTANIAAVGAAVVVETPAALAAAVDGLLGDGDALAGMAVAAATVCDGRGVRRAAMAVQPEIAADGLPIRVRPATMDDAELMLAWQRAPETRRFAHNPAAPERDTHFDWCRSRLADPETVLSIILHDEAPAGVLRLDRRAAEDTAGTRAFVVSILVAPERHQRGIGAATLALAHRLEPDALLLADVLAENQASQALFRRAGYVWRGGRYEQWPAGTASVGAVAGKNAGG
jgi:RimJ/RimL family protein N-acetyltransferase